jgi:hypothetical protein
MRRLVCVPVLSALAALPLDHYPVDATGLAFLGHGRTQAVAEPVRLFGSALVVHPQQ